MTIQNVPSPEGFDPSNLDRLVSEKEAARVLGISHRTLQKWRVQGGGPSYVKLSRAVRYRLRDLKSWTDARICAHTSVKAVA